MKGLVAVVEGAFITRCYPGDATDLPGILQTPHKIESPLKSHLLDEMSLEQQVKAYKKIKVRRFKLKGGEYSRLEKSLLLGIVTDDFTA
ncbi:uncharacterized protein KY384_004034 [Bacidia gigantensis]|uniref:uncharacterized protein n=1 Tax=Bacidia gigantensis TaxID=2732470 RepID=UPI001D03E45E|nr:uncharacterized protein KY384_004034 [Bacidia gigantensis]KAG8530679.1 hypothetical protein KY384_004034 [Bacidia gigantensis]